jgi:tRNA-dihydrouridine synthase B
MKLYNQNLTKGFLLAPMSGYTNWPMRMLCRKYGAELCYTEMISAAGMIRGTKNTENLLLRPDEDKPLVVQMFTASVDEACQAARMLENEGFEGIDINMGCPAKKIICKGAGAALMKDMEKAVLMADAVKNAVNMPVSVKMRAGWDIGTMNADKIAGALEKTGIDCLILHPRTKTDMYRGTPRWEIFSRVKESTRLPVVASGDIRSPEDIEEVRDLSADAFMVGRGAVGRPWIFRELAGGDPPDLEERKEVMLEHIDLLCRCFDQRKGVLHMRKFISAYVRGMPDASHFKQRACSTDNAQALISTIEDFFNRFIS